MAPAVIFGSTSARSRARKSSTSHGISNVSSMTGVGAVIASLATVTFAFLSALAIRLVRNASSPGSGVSRYSLASNDCTPA